MLVHPGAASESRRWPARRFAAVARALRRAGHRVRVTGAAGERDLALHGAASTGVPDGDVLAGRTGLTDLAALVSRAALVVCGDTAMAHLATAYACPSVVLFGPTPPHLWGPPPHGPHVVLWHGHDDASGDPHGAVPDTALPRISVEEVLGAVDRLMACHHALGRTAMGL